ncbi:MAG: hypothetical protein PF570_06625, partial [Candidatus Cloacimonetes bacterium]|nr:hypothetical protein [Candidatus Cloacimonadota bacterium]
MNYALRNTLILLILLVLVVVGFLLGNTSSVKKLRVIKTIYASNQKQLNDLNAANPDMKDQELFVKALKDLEKKLPNFKFVPTISR